MNSNFVNESECKPEISPVYSESELEGARLRMAEIRFDCVVKMYDFGTRPAPYFSKKPNPSQWFALKLNITLEGIKYADEYSLGRQLKEAYMKLEKHIKDYETGQLL